MFLYFQQQELLLQSKKKTYNVVATQACKTQLFNSFQKEENMFIHGEMPSHIWDVGHKQCTCTKNIFKNEYMILKPSLSQPSRLIFFFFKD